MYFRDHETTEQREVHTRVCRDSVASLDQPSYYKGEETCSEVEEGDKAWRLVRCSRSEHPYIHSLDHVLFSLGASVIPGKSHMKVLSVHSLLLTHVRGTKEAKSGAYQYYNRA